MNLYRIRNEEDYKVHAQLNKPNYYLMHTYESTLNNNQQKEFTVKGISYPANQYVDFKVDYLYSDGKNINWRERLICPITGLNNRLRCSIHLMDIELTPYPESKIYISEQVTPMYTHIKNKYVNTTGSEYLQDDLPPGTILNDIRHEDMTRLSFPNEEVDFYLSFECFEHIPFYKKAIDEIYRVLKPNGAFFGSFPFDINHYHNNIKATIDKDGNVVHFCEPEYHGDPVNGQGILCYTIFGWEVLDEFRAAGFREVYVVLLWSDIYGYLGGEQVYFVAKK